MAVSSCELVESSRTEMVPSAWCLTLFDWRQWEPSITQVPEDETTPVVSLPSAQSEPVRPGDGAALAAVAFGTVSSDGSTVVWIPSLFDEIRSRISLATSSGVRFPTEI